MDIKGKVVRSYLRPKFLKFYFEFSYSQRMKIGKARLEDITMLEVTGFFGKY